MHLLLLISALAAVAFAGKVRYDHYKVFEVTPTSTNQINVLAQLESNSEYDFWSELRQIGLPTTVMVAPKKQSTFLNLMTILNIPHKMIIGNVQNALDLEDMVLRTAPELLQGKISFTSYQRFDAINGYLAEIAASYPDLVSIENIGASSQGRNLNLLKICSGGCGNKPAILIDGGIHAREWISESMVLWIIQELVEKSTNNDLATALDWYILPSLNPDGYEYSHTNDRLWRKTRRPNSRCVGTDGNRNFDFHWMETGTSSDQCSDIYAGNVPFSEPETTAISRFATANKDQIKLYLTFHSYGQYLLYPWGYTSAYPSDAPELQSLGDSVAAAIRAESDTRYTVGSSTNVLYAAAGGSDDWMKGVAGIELSYTIELPGGGIWGFDLPPSRIIPVAQETWPGIRVYAEYVLEKFRK